MGQEIVYCWKCKELLRTADFEKGKAVRAGDIVSCKECAEGLPVETPTPRRPTESSGKLRALGGRPATTRRAARGPAGAGIALAVAGVVGFGLLAALALSSGGSARPPDPRPPSPPPSTTVPAPTKAPEPVREASRPARPVREDPSPAVLQAIRTLTASRKEKPGELLAHLERARDLALEASATPHAAEAQKLLDELRKEADDRCAADIKALAERMKAASTGEDFGAALAAIDGGKWPFPDWRRAAEESRETLLKAARERLGPLKEQALKQKREGGDPAGLVARVKRWGIPELAGDLERALAAVAAPAPKAAPDRKAYDRAWTEAFALAGARQYARAIQILEGLPEELRPEAAADLESLRAAQSVWTDVLAALARWPKSQKLTLEYVDLGGTIQKVDDVPLRITPAWAEVRRDKGTVFVEFSEITAASVADLYLRRRESRGEKELRVAALLLAFEGAVQAARALKVPLPESVVGRAAGDAEREAAARSLFAEAERQSSVPGGQGLGAGTCRKLLEEHGGASIVLRHRVELEERAKAGKDNVFLVEDLRGAGSFRRTEIKGADAWVSASESDAESFVEAEFHALEGLEYRAWAFLGGCCVESLSLQVSGSELEAAPLKAAAAPVVKVHAKHQSRAPTHLWAWTEIPLPKYGTPGLKRIRIATSHAGSAVQQIAVGAGRQAPPTAAELKEVERQRQERPPRLRLGNLVLHRAIDLNGPGGTIDGRTWEGKGAPDVTWSGAAFDSPGIALIPETDAARAAMIRSSVWKGEGSNVTVGGLPNGAYEVYLYVWEDSDSQTFDLFVQGRRVRQGYVSGAAGRWERLGPWAAEVADGKIELRAGKGDANFSGLELWRVYR